MGMLGVGGLRRILSKSRSLLLPSYATALICVLCAGRVLAQDFQHLAPKTLSSHSVAGGIVPASGPNIAAKNSKPILKRLIGLRLVGKAAWVQANGFRGQGLMVVGLGLLQKAEIQAKLRVFVGKPLSIVGMQ